MAQINQKDRSKVVLYFSLNQMAWREISVFCSKSAVNFSRCHDYFAATYDLRL